MIRIALTVHQPYATLLAHGVKDIENRGRALPSTRTGRRLWIHAGKTIRPVEADPFAWEQVAALGWGIEEIQADAGRILGWVIPGGSHPPDDCYATGHWVGGCTCAGISVGIGIQHEPGCGLEPWCSPWADPDAHHWQMSDATPLDDPPACRGQQGLWRIPEEVQP